MALQLGPAWLFCPAHQPARFTKALQRADAVILDLEDAVPRDQKDDARRNVASSALDRTRTVVRVRGDDAEAMRDDLAAVAQSPYRYVMVSKASAETRWDLVSGYEVIAQCESPRGVLDLPAIAALPQVLALAWGSEDLVGGIGGTSSRHADGTYRDVVRHVRTTVLLTAAAFGKAAVDAIYADFRDEWGLATEAEDAAASGFSASACIHPGQVATIRRAYAPTSEAIEHATRVVRAAEADDGAISLNGAMVDAPLVLQARRVLARAEAAAAGPSA